MDVPEYGYESTSTDDRESLIINFRAYKRRFYILVVFTLFGSLQSMIWNTWGPVSHSASLAYGWDNTILALLPNWGTIIFILAFVLMVQLLLRYGLRMTMLHCSFFLALGTGLRCIPGNNLLKTISANVCAVLVGYCGTLTMIAPTAVSALWFPSSERTTSTAFITILSNNVANAFCFLIPRLMVRDFNVTSINNETIKEVSEMRKDLDNFMLTEFGLCLFLLILVIIYFPKKPPTPPSSSASIGRVDFKSGAVTLFRSYKFWMILLAYAGPAGFQNAFMSILDEVFYSFNISQDESNWIAVYASLGSIPSGLIFSRLSDWKKPLMKPLLIFTVFLSGLSYGWFALMSYDVFPGSKAMVYASFILATFFSNGAIPLYYELSCEISYPVSEAVVTGFMTAANNVFGFLILLLVMIKQIGTHWTIPVVGVSYLVVAIFFLLPLRATYRRSDIDDDKETNEVVNPGVNT